MSTLKFVTLLVLLLLCYNHPSDAQTLYYYTGSQSDVNGAIAQINTNCGFPDGYSLTWAYATQAYQQPTFYFCTAPPSAGYMEGGPPYHSFTQAEMTAGVINVSLQPWNASWLPPYVPPLVQLSTAQKREKFCIDNCVELCNRVEDNLKK